MEDIDLFLFENLLKINVFFLISMFGLQLDKCTAITL